MGQVISITSFGRSLVDDADATAALTTLGAGTATWTGQHTWSKNGAASTPTGSFTGTWYSGGTATTTKPYILIEPTGTTSTGWSTSGTGLGINAASGFTGNLLDLQVAGSSAVQIGSTGKLKLGQSGAIPGNLNGTAGGLYVHLSTGVNLFARSTNEFGFCTDDVNAYADGLIGAANLEFRIGQTATTWYKMFGGSGHFTAGGSSDLAQIAAVCDAAGTIGYVVRGIASQTAPLVQLQGQSSTTAGRAQAEVDTAWIDSTDATRKARAVRRAYDTAARETDRGWADGSAGRFACAAPASAPTDAHLAASQISFYMDEGGNKLHVRVKYADGTTLKTGEIALT